MWIELAGVGLEGARKEKLGVEKAKRTLQESNAQARFVERKRQKLDEKRIQHDLIRARRACEDLDAQAVCCLIGLIATLPRLGRWTACFLARAVESRARSKPDRC